MNNPSNPSINIRTDLDITYCGTHRSQNLHDGFMNKFNDPSAKAKPMSIISNLQLSGGTYRTQTRLLAVRQ